MLKAGNQRGITSIVVVFVLVVLLTLVGIGFTKVMNRSLQSSSASQQASAASYAAQSGINDAISYVTKALEANPNVDVSSNQCGTLIDPGGPLEQAAKLSPDGSTAYTCVLVDPNPTSLFYQNLAPYKSQVIKITTVAPLASLLFSWQASNRQQNQFVPIADGTILYDEKTWSDKNYAPLLRLTLYPIPVSGDLSNVQASAKTFFLYPQSGGSNSIAYSSSSGLQPVNCSSKNLGSFAGSADYDCNLVVNSLTSAGAAYFYARLTPFYAQSVVKVKGNDGSNQAVQFKNVQSVIDVTAKSGSAVKRLQARMDSSSSGSGTDLNISSGSDSAPEFAIQTASTLCKRLLIPPATTSPAVIDPGSVLNCGLSLTDATPPAVPPPAVPPPAAPASGGSEASGPGGGLTLPPDCYLTFGSDGNPLGWGCTNSHSGGQGQLSGPVYLDPPFNRCAQWTVTDWNYAGVGSRSYTTGDCSGIAPGPVPSPTNSNCGPNAIGDFPNCTPNWILDMGGGRCPDGYQGTPRLEPGVWYGPPGTVYPGCYLPEVVNPGTPTGTPGNIGIGLPDNSCGYWCDYDPIIQFPPQEPAWDPCAGDCWSPPEPVYNPPWTPPAKIRKGSGGSGCGFNNKNRVWPFYGNIFIPRYFGYFIC